MPKYKEAILEIVNGSQRHLTAEQVFALMREQYPSIAMATVYNNLNRLHEQGAIRKIGFDGGPDRFDRNTRHDHLVCKRCGRIADLEFTELSEELAAFIGSPVEGYDLKVYYTCPACQEELAAQA